MKLIMESWRSFVKEAAVSEAKRLAIFDFDGTIGFTGAKVAVLNKNTGKTARLSDKEFLAFLETLPEDERKNIEEKPNESENYKADYSEYATVSDDTVENRPVLEKMAQFAEDNETSLLVLTARAPGEEGPGGDPESATDDIQTYLHTFGIKPDHIMALAGAPKAEFIDGLLRKNKSITELEVYEDSKSNLDSIDSMMERRYSDLYGIIRPATGRDVRGRLVKYSLFLVDGNSVTKLDTKADTARNYRKEEKDALLAMSQYLKDNPKGYNIRLIGGISKDKGILDWISSGFRSYKSALEFIKQAFEQAEDDMSVDTTSWAKHYDAFFKKMDGQIYN